MICYDSFLQRRHARPHTLDAAMCDSEQASVGLRGFWVCCGVRGPALRLGRGERLADTWRSIAQERLGSMAPCMDEAVVWPMGVTQQAARRRELCGT